MKPHAEVEQVWPEDGRVRVLGFLHDVDPGDSGDPGDPGDTGDWRLRLTLREPRGPELDYPARISGRSFEVSLPIADLIAPQAPQGGVWDLHLVTGETRLRMGRRLDDIRDKTSIMVYPAQLVPTGEGAVHVRPRYTVNENLSIDYWCGS